MSRPAMSAQALREERAEQERRGVRTKQALRRNPVVVALRFVVDVLSLLLF